MTLLNELDPSFNPCPLLTTSDSTPAVDGAAVLPAARGSSLDAGGRVNDAAPDLGADMA